MKVIALKLICLLSKFFCYLSIVFLKNNKLQQVYIKLLDFYFLNLSEMTTQHFTFHKRPALSIDFFASKLFMNNISYSDFAIVIQGPIKEKNNFTLETVRLYKKNYPECIVILSTWKNSIPTSVIDDFIKSGAVVLLNEKPIVSGSHNVNFQIVSALSGVLEAEKRECRFVLKTRTDQRMYSPNALDILKNYLIMYPVDNSLQAKGRIIEPGITVCKYRIWSMCDMFQFGYTDDMKRMWSVKLDARNRTQQEFSSKRYLVKDIVHENVAEIYLHRAYAQTLGMDASANSIAYYNFIKSSMVVFDKEQIDLYWPKYTSEEYGWAKNPMYDEKQTLARLTHYEWLNIYSGAVINHEFVSSIMNSYEN